MDMPAHLVALLDAIDAAGTDTVTGPGLLRAVCVVAAARYQPAADGPIGYGVLDTWTGRPVLADRTGLDRARALAAEQNAHNVADVLAATGLSGLVNVAA